MAQPTAGLEAELVRLSREVAALGRRVAALERARGGSSAPAEGAPVVAPPAAPAPAEAPFVPLVGRTLVVLGGAYLLRALSDSGSLPGRTGALAGLAYAAAWLVAADRTAARSPRGAIFHGLAAVLVGVPLLLETAARFGTVPVPLAAAGLVALHAAASVVALRRGLEPLAWIATLAAAGAAPALLMGTRALLPALGAALGSAAVMEVVSARSDWGGLRWPLAAAADAVALALAWILSRGGALPEGYATLSPTTGAAALLLLPLLYLASMATRTLIFRRRVSGFAIVQSAAALLVGVGGAEWVLATRGARPFGLYLALVALGGLAYALGFTWIDRHEGRGRNYYFYSILGFVLVLAGTGGVLSGAVLSALWVALAVALAGFGLRYDRDTLRAQSVACWLGAAAVARLLHEAAAGLLAPAGAGGRAPGTVAVLAALAGPLCYALLLAARPGSPRWAERVPRTLLAAASALVLAGLAAAFLQRTFGSSGDAGLVATLRTAVLAAVGVGLALAHRRWGAPELRWLVTPTLVLGGLKLVFEDLPRGRPATLFVSLAAYGGALILAPRLLRRD